MSDLPGKPADYFSVKGKNAEEFVHRVAEDTFFVDWCFPNPKRPDGKELCDLLVVFGDIAVIWQVKSLKLDEKEQPNQSEVQKNIRQAIGARNYLLRTNGPVDLQNARRKIEHCDFSTIKRIFLISALLCDPTVNTIAERSDKGDWIHVMNGHFIERCLEEVDTIRDFIDYLKAKEELWNSGSTLTVLGGEEELLAFYLLHDRSLNELKEQHVLVDSGFWTKLHEHPQYLAAMKADEISKVWDRLIDEVHNRTDERADYEPIARIMASLTRFERREAAGAFMSALHKASIQDLHGASFRRLFALNPDKKDREHLRSDVTFCFLFHDVCDPREDSAKYKRERDGRYDELGAVVCVVRCRVDRPVVVGIATEPEHGNRGRSFDFALLEMPQVSADWRTLVEEQACKDGIFVNPDWYSGRAEEYPDTALNATEEKE